MRRLPLVAVIALGIEACTLLVDTSDLTGGPAGADSGSDVGPVGTADASGDAFVEAVEAGFSCDAAVPKPTICTTFDEPKFDDKQWDGVVDQTGSIAIENGNLVTTTGTTGEDFRAAYVQDSFSKVNGMHIEADVRIDASEATTNGLGGRFLGLHTDGWNAFVGLKNGELVVSENWGSNGGMNALHGNAPYVAGAWIHVSFDVDFEKETYAVAIDGTTITDGSKLAGPYDNTKVGAVIGIYFAPVSGTGWKVRYDNVAITGR